MRKQRESLQKKTFVPIIGLLFLIILVSMNHVPVYAAAKVASIGSKKYTSLQKAVDSVKNGQTIKLLKNVSLKKTVVSKARNVKYTINLNEHTITGNSSKAVFKFKKNNKVTLKNGKIKHGKKYAGNILIECDDAVLTIASGTYSNGNPVFDVDDGKLNINSGTVVGAVYAEDSEVTIKGGTIKEAYFNIYDESTLKIKGGTILSDSWSGMVYLAKSELLMTKGTVKFSSDSALCMVQAEKKSSVRINGGRISLNKNNRCPVFLMSSNSKFQQNGGSITSSGSVVVGSDPVEEETEEEDWLDEDI